MKNKVTLFLLAVLMLLCVVGNGFAQENADADHWTTHVADLAHSRIALVTGSLQTQILPKVLTEAEYTEFNMIADAAAALAMGKVDAFSAENSVYLAMRREGQSFVRIDEPLFVSEFGMVFGNNRDPQIKEDFNAFLEKCKENGVLAALDEKWFGENEPVEVLPLSGFAQDGKPLSFVTTTQKPYSYIKDGVYTGFDIELMILFAHEYGYKLEVVDSTFSGILTGLEQGKYDMGGSGITIPEERRQSIDFSDVYHVEDVVMVVADNGQKRLNDFSNASLGVIDGSIYDGFSRQLFPDADIQSYPSFNDLFQCVKQGKIDGFLLDIPNFNAVQRTDRKLSYISVPGYSVEIGIAFGKNEKGEKLQAQMNDFIQLIRANGTYEELWNKWCGESEPMQTPTVPDFSGSTEKLNVVLDLSRKPFVYLLNEAYAGFEVELMYLFCEAYGYRPVFESAQWTSGVAGLKTGKYDVVSCGIYMTEERKESVNFCDPYAVADVVMVIYDGGDDVGNVWNNLRQSFERTFIRENRWKLIVRGLGNTVLISIGAVFGGSVLGFALYLLTRSRYGVVSALTRGIARVYARLIAGTPTLVVLMLLFYVVFGKSDVDGLWVAMLGFTLTFGSFVFGHLRLSVESVDRGQTEASYALGYTRNQTFFRVILPQSMKRFLPTYTAEVVGLIKATSVVGYIAVGDLTKMGDIIRSNTYEAMFPLLAVAVIYFIVTWGAAALLGMLTKKFDNHKRKNASILKGVVR